MKLTKSLFLAFAGLGLFACSNEDLKNGIEGDATVSVRINEAVSRVLENPSTGANDAKFPVDIQNATISLIASAGGVTDQDIVTQLNGNGNSTITFSNVRNPQKLELKINNCAAADGLKLKDVYNKGLAEPLYAVTTSFEKKSELEYTATLQPQHRLARLQFSGINFKTEGSTYTSLKLDGIYLNGAVKTEGGSDKAVANTAGEWSTIKTALGADAPLYDEINKVVIGTGSEAGPWPKDGAESKKQCYAYNIFPVTAKADLPKLTVCFSDAAQLAVNIGEYRYARVGKYIIDGDRGSLAGINAESGEIEQFVAGYIYNITNLMIEDKDLGPTPDGGKDITLTATVTVLPWTLVNGKVEWN